MATESTTYRLETNTARVDITATLSNDHLVLELTSHHDHPSLKSDDIVLVPNGDNRPSAVRVWITNDTRTTLYGRSTREDVHTDFTREGNNLYCDHSLAQTDNLWTFKISRQAIGGDDPLEISPKLKTKKVGGDDE